MAVTSGTATAKGHQAGERRDGVSALKLTVTPARLTEDRETYADPDSSGECG